MLYLLPFQRGQRIADIERRSHTQLLGEPDIVDAARGFQVSGVLTLQGADLR